MLILRLLALLLLLWAAPAWATVSFVQITENSDASSNGTVGVVVPSLTVGQLGVMLCACASGQNPISASDSLGNTWFPFSSSWTANSITSRAFALTVPVGGSSPTVTCTFDGSATNRAISVAQFAETGTSWGFDGENHAGATSSASPGPSIAITTTATDVLIGFNLPQLVETVPPAGWTRACVGCSVRMDYKIGAAAGSNDYQPTWTGTNTINDQILAFTEVGAGPPTTNRTRGRIQ